MCMNNICYQYLKSVFGNTILNHCCAHLCAADYITVMYPDVVMVVWEQVMILVWPTGIRLHYFYVCHIIYKMYRKLGQLCTVMLDNMIMIPCYWHQKLVFDIALIISINQYAQQTLPTKMICCLTIKYQCQLFSVYLNNYGVSMLCQTQSIYIPSYHRYC